MEEISRRSFLKCSASAGAAIALQPPTKLVQRLIPYITPPDQIRPGVWSLFATTCRECPAGCGMHIRHIDGRAIKAEGNPLHPVNQGALCARGQSSVQGLYDPDRVRQALFRRGGDDPRPTGWPLALQAVGQRLRESGGRVALLSDLQTGALAEVMQAFVRALGSQRVLFYESFNYEALCVAHERVLGLTVIPDYRLEACDSILSLSADFLETWISPVQFARAFAESHAYSGGKRGRLCYAGPRLSMTAANADEFLRVPPGAESWVALAMLKIMAGRGWIRGSAEWVAPWIKAVDVAAVESLTGVPASRLEALAKAFFEAKASVALAGPAGATGKSAIDTAVAAALLNHAAGRIGQTVDFARPHALGRAARQNDVMRFLADLTEKDVLIIHGANPVYAIPGAAEHIRRAGAVVYMGTLMDETARLASWFLPVNSPLESWGDFEPCDGVNGLMQPAMARLHDTRHAGDVLLALAEAAGKPLSREGAAAPVAHFEQWLSLRWKAIAAQRAPGRAFDEFWTESLRQGGSWAKPADAAPAIAVRAPDPALSPPPSPAAIAPSSSTPPSMADLWLWPSIMLFDGRFANRGWLQESPEPVSTLVWTNWVDMHPKKAAQLGLSAGDVVALSNEAGEARAPVRITEDVAEGVVALAFGQGHTAMGRNADRRGANAFALQGRAPDSTPFGSVRIRKTGQRFEPVSTCATQDQHHREIIQWAGFADVSALQPGQGTPVILPLPEGYSETHDLYPPHTYPHHRWAMVADLDRCNGCGACGVACYAENNLPVVGEEQTRRGREMAWMRVVPYRDPDDAARAGFIPLFCQQCDAAPCEPVCPVFASVHNDEGLNAQVYNRCIGTRYCSHNCPYKVRRFNWLNTEWPAPLDRQLNPDVTVRSRGVMEKCTFCIQRIREVEYRARREDRPVQDGEIKPACVQTCPARALVFGDLMDPKSLVSDLTRRDPRRYHVLEELNTKPAVTYLRRVKA